MNFLLLLVPQVWPGVLPKFPQEAGALLRRGNVSHLDFLSFELLSKWVSFAAFYSGKSKWNASEIIPRGYYLIILSWSKELGKYKLEN